MDHGVLSLLAERVGLKETPSEFSSLDGGRQHELWRVDAEGQSIVVKKLSRQCFLGLRDARHFEKTESLAARISEHLPFAVSALSHDGRFVIDHDEGHYIFYPYLQGAFEEDLSEAQCFTVGRQLGDIHHINIKESYFKPECIEAFDVTLWEGALREHVSLEYFGAWFENFTALADSCLEAMKNTRYPLILSHRDLNRQNILWLGDSAHFIDWESAGLINPSVELLGLALNLAGAESGVLAMNKVEATLEGYRQSHGRLPMLDETLYWQAYLTWFAWLDHCLAEDNHFLSEAELNREVEGSLNVISVMQSYRAVLLACFNPSHNQKGASPLYICSND